MQPENFDPANLGPVLALAAATVLFGLLNVVAEELSKRSRRQAAQEVEKISSTVTATAETERLRAIQAIAEKLPEAASREDFLAALERLAKAPVDQIDLLPETAEEKLTRSLVEDLVTSYHLQALSQARQQFYFSLGAAVVGFIYILVMVALSYQTPGADLIVRVLPGIAIEAVAALFFRQAEQTRERATALYDRLRSDDQRTQALGLIETVTNDDVKSLAKAHMALHMAGLSTPPLEPANWLELARKRAISTDWSCPPTVDTRSLGT
jgi:hypothetical protein